MENQEDIRKLLQEKFQDFEPEPDRDIWAGIQRAVRPVPFYKKVGGYGYAVAAVVLLLLAMGISMTDILYRQPVSPARRVAADAQTPPTPEQALPGAEAKNAFADQSAQEAASPKSPSIKDESPRTALQTPTAPASLAVTGAGERTAQPNDIDKEKPKNDLPPLFAITPLTGNPLPIPSEAAVQEIGNIGPLPVLAVAEVNSEGDRKRIDLDGLSIDDALSLAGNGLKKLATKPDEVLTSQDGTETIKTYRINFLDISISKKTHTIKPSTKKET